MQTNSFNTSAIKPAQLAELYATDPLKACGAALLLTCNLPERHRLEAINDLLGTYGTESIRGDWQNGYWCDVVAAYCNTGDTHALTVIQVRGDWSGAASRFIVSSFGDFVEHNQSKLGIL